MRVKRAGLEDSYKVHKTIEEYLEDLGSGIAAPAYQEWIAKLLDENRFYYLLMHSKKIVGMIWGSKEDTGSQVRVLIEGQFLRRAYRKSFRFKRDLVLLRRGIVAGASVVRMILPGMGAQKIAPRYKQIGLLVELSKPKKEGVLSNG